MTITITNPPSGGVGVGLQILASIDAVPTPNSRLIAYVMQPSTTHQIARSPRLLISSPGNFSLIPTESRFWAAALGGAVDLRIDLEDGVTTFVTDQLVVTGTYTHDPISGLEYALSLLSGGGAYHDPMLDTILAAVRRTY